MIEMTTGERRLKINNENEDKLEGGTITRYIKAQHLKWVGHVMRRNPTEISKEWKNGSNYDHREGRDQGKNDQRI